MERARHNVYALIHKALRLAMAEALPAVGRLDAGDSQEVSDAIVRVRDLLRFCRMHVEAEETFVHPAIEARRPGVSARVAAELIARDVVIDHRPNAGIRMAPHFYTTDDEIDHALGVLDELVRG